MIASCDSLLLRLRRSALGAWLATAYALAVLAAALTPMAAPFAWAAEPGLVLCSGTALPADPSGGGSDLPAGEPGHCKACPHHPVLAAPPTPMAGAVLRRLASMPAVTAPGETLPQGRVAGLPPSRAPPAA